jgi:hypothetical protein
MKKTTIEKYSYTNENSRGNLPFPNCCHFLAKVLDFCLHYCFLKENTKKRPSGIHIAASRSTEKQNVLAQAPI